MANKGVIPSSSLENNINKYLSNLIYAGLKDFDDDADDYHPFPSEIYDNYDNRIQDKELQEKLKPVFKISTEVRQFIASMFRQMVEELKDIEINTKINLDTLCKKLEEITEDSVAVFMFNLGRQYEDIIGRTLNNYGDKTQWFSSTIAGQLSKHASNTYLCSLSSQRFDFFMKALAYVFAAYVWQIGKKQTISSAVARCVFAILGMPQHMIVNLVSELRPKAKRAPKKSKVADADETNEVDDETNEVADADETNEVADADETNEVDDETNEVDDADDE